MNNLSPQPFKFGAIALAVTLALAGCGDNDSSAKNHLIVFENVTVIPMTDDTALENQTVIVRDGEIYDIGSSDVLEAPDGATVIDGRGRYLMPGLADMHIHPLCGPQGCYYGQKEAEIYLAHGVTTVLSMQDTSGTEQNLVKSELADPIKDGTLFGPTIYTASFAGGADDIGGNVHATQVVTTEQQGRNHVINSKAQGYDFIKVYDGLTHLGFQGIKAQAEEEGMAIIGHFPQTDIVEALRDGLNMVAHASAYGLFNINSGLGLPPISEAIAATVENHVYVNTTLTLNKKSVDLACANEEALNSLKQQPHVKRYANSIELALWSVYLQPITNFLGENCSEQAMANIYQGVLGYTNDLRNAGVKLVLGTDSPLVWGVPGYSAHEELQTLSELPTITPYEVLTIATRNAGDFVADWVPNSQPFGTIEIGKRADLLLVEENPLIDVSHVQDQVGVMARGRWYTAEELATRLDNIANEYAQTP